MPNISIIAALGKNRVIGHTNTLLWRIPDDLKRFKALTMGNPIIMGRKTFESIGKPLPGRTNIVITRNPEWKREGVITVHTLDEALEKARENNPKEIFVIGGGEIYALALPLAHTLYLTLVSSDGQGDTFFPPYETTFTKKVFEEKREWNGLRYMWVNLEK